ncbi:MAG: sugar phosphate isomerase/epimerase [Phycisphaeraceae bacterium]|nr:sugar phosphate isomerase/epimerase [Phycisphaeraceae bacterium]
MLLTLSSTSLDPLLRPARGKPKLDLLDLPQYARDTLALNGLHLSTDLLAGADRARLETLRDRADKAACSCLLLWEREPLGLADDDPDVAEAALNRTRRIIEAAHLLGCNSAAIRLRAEDTDDAFERATDMLREAVDRAERLELNLLISPTEGLTATPDRVTDLIKKTARFRVMTYPDFGAAASAKDPITYLRRLTPYAGALVASTKKFANEPAKGASKEDAWECSDNPGEHTAFDLTAMIETIVSVGFDGPIAVDYRGSADATLGTLMSRSAIEALLEPRPAEE